MITLLCLSDLDSFLFCEHNESSSPEPEDVFNESLADGSDFLPAVWLFFAKLTSPTE